MHIAMISNIVSIGLTYNDLYKVSIGVRYYDL